ncbi:hypothetical protein [Paenibacillus sp. tmac-D7]|nr:hypothetical protein [Paenibacillus sp. tmac-D7]
MRDLEAGRPFGISPACGQEQCPSIAGTTSGLPGDAAVVAK